MLTLVHDAAHDRVTARAEAQAGARDYALPPGRSAAAADVYGHEYAELSCAANGRSFAEVGTQAPGTALAARAWAVGGCEEYADTFPGSFVRAVRARETGTAPSAPGPGLRPRRPA